MASSSRNEIPPSDSILVFFDIQTSDFNGEIIQIAAVIYDEPVEEFTKYIMPEKGININASQKNGFKVIEGNLTLDGEPVDTTPSIEVAEEFISFLQNHGNIILVGANFKRFILPKILRWLENETGNLDNNTMKWYCDTLDIFPGENKALTYLAENHLTDEIYRNDLMNIHKATVKCKIMRALLNHLNIDKNAVIRKSTSRVQNYRKTTTQ